MEHLQKPETLQCDAVAQILESSLVGPPLTSQQKDAIHHHAQHCGDCHTLLALMHQLRAVSDSLHAGDFEEEIASVRKEWQNPRLTHFSNSSRLRVWVASLAAAALLLFGLWQIFGSLREPESLVSSTSCVPTASLSPVDGVHITHCRELGAPETTVRDGAVRVVLMQGSVALNVDPDRKDPRAVVVQTPEGEVRVKGTLFAVHVDEHDERVEVFRGIVEVWAQKADASGLLVSAGSGAIIHLGQKYELKKPIREQLIIALKEQPTGTLTPHDDVSGGVVSEDDTSIESNAKLNSVAPGNDTEPMPRVETTPVRMSSGRVESMESLLESARFCLIENDWSCAEKRYSEALRFHAQHPAASAVHISLAKLELRRLNAPKKALRHYSAYLQKNPNGPLAEEALLGMANAHRRLQHTKDEMTALRRLLSLYPDGAMAAKAQNRLTQLEAEQPR